MTDAALQSIAAAYGTPTFVFDADGDFESHCNTEMVSLERVVSTEEQARMSDRTTWHR